MYSRGTRLVLKRKFDFHNQCNLFLVEFIVAEIYCSIARSPRVPHSMGHKRIRTDDDDSVDGGRWKLITEKLIWAKTEEEEEEEGIVMPFCSTTSNSYGRLIYHQAIKDFSSKNVPFDVHIKCRQSHSVFYLRWARYLLQHVIMYSHEQNDNNSAFSV